jgi:hypothetical protein
VTLVFEVSSFTLASFLSLRRCQNTAVSFPRVFLLLHLCIHFMNFVGLRIVCASPASQSLHQLYMQLYASIT